jgi:hypothetical protein
MTVYVDNYRVPATVNRIKGRWSHLTADTVEELNAFAAGIGLKPEWFQVCKKRCGPEGAPCPHWHYDVTDPKREAAIAAGAQAIELRQFGDLITARRAEYRAAMESQ